VEVTGGLATDACGRGGGRNSKPRPLLTRVENAAVDPDTAVAMAGLTDSFVLVILDVGVVVARLFPELAEIPRPPERCMS